MKKKINIRLISIATISIFLTLFLVICVFYELFKNQIIEDLKSYTHILKESEVVMNGSETDVIEAYHTEMDNLRITVIDPDGKVLIDTWALTESMENHQTRPEFVEALRTGEGTDIRKSETLSKNTFYYAVRMDNGNVLRVSKEASSLLHVFGKALPIILVITVLLIAVSSIAAHLLTKSLVAPIEYIANHLDQPEEMQVYPELVPFIDTIKKQHEDILKNAQIRQEFTANVSHELKTPLTSISGYSELIENGMVEEKHITRFAHEIHHNATRLLTLINDIIRLSELDATEFENTFEKLDLYGIAKNTVEMLHMNAAKHSVSLYFSGTEPCMVFANRQMMEEVLYNLCDNAIRYNNTDGSVWVKVHMEEDQPTLIVKDTGIGISKEHQDRIFERFYRVDKSRSKSTGGTGLGLAIVKHIVAQHNAQLTLDSEIGKGTEIKIRFPKPEEYERAKVQPEASAGISHDQEVPEAPADDQ